MVRPELTRRKAITPRQQTGDDADRHNAERGSQTMSLSVKLLRLRDVDRRDENSRA
jgi:hypothetical protein